MRGALADLKDSLDETLEREFNRISDKGVFLLQLIIIDYFVLDVMYGKYTTVFFAFPVISLKETSNQRTSERTKSMQFLFLFFMVKLSLTMSCISSSSVFVPSAKEADIPYDSEPKMRADFLQCEYNYFMNHLRQINSWFVL